MFKAKVSTAQIAAVIGCSRRTIYREKQRGLCEQLNHRTSKTYMIYSAQKSQNRADQMRDLHKGRPVKLCPQLAAHLEDYIGKRHYSPAAAVREILLQGMALPQISTNTAYRYIYRGYLRLCSLDLPVGRYQLKKKQNEQYIAKNHKNDRSIEERLGRGGDPRGCRLLGDGHGSRAKAPAEPLPAGADPSARPATRSSAYWKAKLPARYCGCCIHSGIIWARTSARSSAAITCDNGCEFSAAKEMEQLTPIYYCHPYSCWERGTNENQNKLIRRFCKKGKSMAGITPDHAEYITLWMNNYPRRLLGWQRPADLMAAECAAPGRKNACLF